MDDKLRDAIEEFITQRMDDLGADAPEAVDQAITALEGRLRQLGSVLSEGQKGLFREVEDALNLQTGEETRYYYRAGFDDAIRFLTEWSRED